MRFEFHPEALAEFEAAADFYAERQAKRLGGSASGLTQTSISDDPEPLPNTFPLKAHK